MKKVLVTGGAGYLGSVMVPALLREGFEVTVLDNFLFGQNSLLDCCAHDSFRVIRGDCRDREVVREALRGKDVLIPLAAIVGAPLCKQDPTAARSVNLEAIRTLLSLRSPDQRILFPNTNSGYGVGEKDAACTEDSPLRPVSLYGQLKVEAERAILDAGNAVCFRLATVFGVSPRMRIDLLVNDFVYRAVTDRVVTVFEGHFRRNFVHILDVTAAFLHGIRNFEALRDRPYNLGLDAANLTKLELCAEIASQVPGFTYSEAAVGEDPDKRDYVVSNQRLREAGFTAGHSLQEGIGQLRKAYTIVRNSRYGNV